MDVQGENFEKIVTIIIALCRAILSVFISPVLGLIAHDASNLIDNNLPNLGGLKVPDGMVPKCVWFDLNGLVKLTNLLPPNTCSTSQQVHFFVVVESNAQAPFPTPTPTPAKKGHSNVWKINVTSVLRELVIISFLCFFVIGLLKYKKKSKFVAMEMYSDQGEALHMPLWR
ncbi:hypothetical protein AMTRI_Chr09g16190 [Amborella trichopoda]